MIGKAEFILIQRYCAYQERCHQEVRYKLVSMKIYGQELENYMTELIKLDYLNEERFARSYARGKYRMKKWGWQKIIRELKKRDISDYCIRMAHEEIDQTEYLANLYLILEKYLNTKQDLNNYQRRESGRKFAFSKGYETPLINKVLDELLTEIE